MIIFACLADTPPSLLAQEGSESATVKDTRQAQREAQGQLIKEEPLAQRKERSEHFRSLSAQGRSEGRERRQQRQKARLNEIRGQRRGNAGISPN